jgi:hypothetical protein
MGEMGRPPLPKDLARTFISIGLAPDVAAALRTFQRRAGISSATEAARVLIMRGLIAEDLIDPDAPPPKRKAPR